MRQRDAEGGRDHGSGRNGESEKWCRGKGSFFITTQPHTPGGEGVLPGAAAAPAGVRCVSRRALGRQGQAEGD